MSPAAAWCAQHRLRFLLPALFLAPVLYFLLSPPSSHPFFSVPASGELPPPGSRVIWAQRRLVEWRPCGWWQKAPMPAPSRRNGYVRIDCYGGLNQLRRDLCDGIGVARLLNATMVLPKFEVAAYWNESSGFADVFDVDYFIEQTRGYVEIVKEIPAEIASKEPFKVDCSKRKGHFDYVKTVLPVLLEHQYISLTPSMNQRRDSELNLTLFNRSIFFYDDGCLYIMRIWCYDIKEITKMLRTNQSQKRHSTGNETTPSGQQSQGQENRAGQFLYSKVPSYIATENRAKRRRINKYKALARQTNESELSSLESIFASKKEFLCFLKGQKPRDRNDIIVRVFHMKLHELLDDIKEGIVFGPIIGALQEDIERMYPLLNEEQQHIFDEVTKNINEGKHFLYFVSGFGGTGKTFLWNCILSKLRSQVSRVTSEEGLKILIENEDGTCGTVTKNIVYKKIIEHL